MLGHIVLLNKNWKKSDNQKEYLVHDPLDNEPLAV